MRNMTWSGRAIYLIVFCFSIGLSYGQTAKAELNVDIIPKPLNIEKGEGFLDFNDVVIIGFDDHISGEIETISLSLLPGFPDLKSTGKYNSIDFEYGREGQSPESYQLEVTLSRVVITANSSVGISRGIATLAQLLYLNEQDGQFFIPLVKIVDTPRFEHRGLLLDCSRHFFKVEVVKKYIDLLALYKMNVLHWHLTEDQGWRIAIDKYPKLTAVGGYRSKLEGGSLGVYYDGARYGGFYSKEEIREIVAYAAKQHIEVIPEIELPGHSQAAIAAYPYLSCTGDSVAVANDWGVFKEIYCAGNDSVFTFLEDVLSEVMELFPSKKIHIGGDEAPKVRWEQCSKCQKRMVDNHLESEEELQSYFIRRIQAFLKANGRELIGWDEILEGGLAEGAIVQSWRGMQGGIEAAKHGHQAIMSPTSHAYFDYDLKAIDVEKVYSFDPVPKSLSSEEAELIIGGECNLWSEHVPDEKTLDSKVFPRLLAMSEVLWSDTTERDYKEFRKRLQSHYSILDSHNVKYGEEEVPLTYQTQFRNDSLFLELIPASEDLTLYYQKSCKNCNDEIFEYHAPVFIDTTCDVMVQVNKNDKQYGKVKQIDLEWHKALNKPVHYATDYSQWYTAGGDLALVDGKRGWMDFKDGNWQGFWGTDFLAIVDLEKATQIDEIEVGFYQYINSWIFIPKEISFETSIDGENWETDRFRKIQPEDVEKKRGKFLQSYFIRSEETFSTRYIRVKVKNIGKVPDWHEAAGSDAWIFMDEIMVR